MNGTEIIRSPAAFNYQLVLFSFTFFALSALSIFILLVPFRYFDSNILLWFLIFVLIGMLFYIISVAILRKTWQGLKYYITDDYLVVMAGPGGMREDTYRYETITNISLQRTRSQKSHTYASLIIKIKSLPQPIVLKDVIEPDKVLEQLQSKIDDAVKMKF